MTDSSFTNPVGLMARARSLDLFRVLTPALAAITLVLAVLESDPAMRFKYAGLTIVLGCIVGYLFEVRNKPILQRPPVHFSRRTKALIVGLCFGMFLCGKGVGGVFGGLIQYGPSFIAIGCAMWLEGAQGYALRTTLADRADEEL